MCGDPVLYNDDLDFGLCVSYLNSNESFEDENKRLSVLRQVAIRNGCRFTSRWNTLVHARRVIYFFGSKFTGRVPLSLITYHRCAVRSSTCNCWLPIGAPFCTLHPQKPRPVKTDKRRWGRMLDSDSEDETAVPIKPPASGQARRAPSPEGECEPEAEAIPAPAPVPLIPILSRAVAPPPPAAKPTQEGWSSLLVRMKPDAPKGALKKKPAAPVKKAAPPEKKTYTDGADEPPKRAWLPREEWLAQRKRDTQGADGFDIQVHGYWLTRSRGLVYRCPDGRELPATGVDSFDARP